jgi:hypothetical protein
MVIGWGKDQNEAVELWVRRNKARIVALHDDDDDDDDADDDDVGNVT